MIRRVLAEMKQGTTTLRELSRKLGIEPGALDGMLRYMVRRGLVRETYHQCRVNECRGCRCLGRCEERPIAGYAAVAQPGRAGGDRAGS